MVPQGGFRDRHWATVPQGVVGDRLPWGGAGQGGGGGLCTPFLVLPLFHCGIQYGSCCLLVVFFLMLALTIAPKIFSAPLEHSAPQGAGSGGHPPPPPLDRPL